MALFSLMFIASTALAAIAFVVVAVLWLKKLRETLATTMAEAALQQIKTSQRLGDALALLEDRQGQDRRRLDLLTQTTMLLKREVESRGQRTKVTERDAERPPSTRVLH